MNDVFKLYVDNGGMGPESRFWEKCFSKSWKNKNAWNWKFAAGNLGGD